MIFQCPNCTKQFKVKDEDVGKRMKCSGCGAEAIVAHPPKVAPVTQPTTTQPATTPPAPSSSPFDTPQQSTRRFSKRLYPASVAIMYFGYGMAVLVALSFAVVAIASGVVVFGGVAATAFAADADAAAPMFALVVAWLIFNLMSFIMHGFLALIYVFFAESIKIVMDIQENTQRTAFNLA